MVVKALARKDASQEALLQAVKARIHEIRDMEE